MAFNPQLLLLALGPIFLALILWEFSHIRKHPQRYPRSQYSWQDTLSNMTLALSHEMTDALANIGVVLIYASLFDHRLFDIPATWWSFLLLFIVQDFCYYWFHRASHRIRWFWASHVVHHSSEHLNLSTAFRQSFTYPLSGMWLFWLPIVAIGFAPEQVITMVMLSLAYQFFIHTPVVKKLGKLEWILSTPSHHRVHHAKNPEYIDQNYGGTLIIWDRLFGTFIEERDDLPCEYGITKQVHSHNPITLTLHEWRDMLGDVLAPGKPFWARLTHFIAPPEWEYKPSATAINRRHQELT